ncbi:MAG: dehydrogenase E1 component subunit alpha/beta [Saprospiraceae bacterium]|nr:dehydrogenase E1 component subunit alpha/beta [Saprospiraceae bacterium]MCF8248949.1 dehydrogenase E1 component subunit alpha/beta [Saprospiraceae bacterium]MCF8310843.1 dehydrogenase E1 component subunit alpha/beta [Saprospiraceae bacterium]MCF8439569.1 dehydrogenase E1 component subunit alpha/beta [Saprospiraceae bacterium]
MPTATTQPIQFKKGKLSKETLLKLYRRLLKPRMVEEKMLILLRQGQVSKWFSGIGQEAIAVGITSALLPDELVFTLHRNLGVFTVRDVPLTTLFSQLQGKKSGFSKGRERSFHFGTLDYGIVGMISHLGPQLALADGTALAHKLKGEKRVAVAFSGEGGTSEGDFHEALNVAAVWDLPVIFVVENNGYGLSTTTKEQFRCANIADKGVGYGMKSVIIDGNNILEVYNTLDKLAVEIRKNPHPVLVECKTFRMRGHEEASGVKYVPKELLEEWALKDPLKNYEHFLMEEGILDEEAIAVFRKEIKDEIDSAWKKTVSEPEIVPDLAEELGDVYAPIPVGSSAVGSWQSDTGAKTEKRYIDAISDGLRLAMQKHENLVLMGQDIADYGGVFKITQGFMEEFGKERVRNTPICESAIVGAALGLSLKGFKSMVEMQFADFVTCAFNQIINNLAKIHYRWGVPADVVVRMPSGGGVGAGPFHSQSNEAWFVHTPGLKVVVPSTPYDAKGLLLAAFEDPNPVMFFEHKALYRSISEEIPDGYYTVEIGKARVAREGSAVSVITYGMGVYWALKVCEEEGIDADIIDLRSLLPVDYQAIVDTVEKTNRVIILHEDTLKGGVGGELAAWISEHLFDQLDGPVLRAAGLDTPIPFAVPLEQNFMPVERFRSQLKKLLNY